jgi:hypothetical protein
MIARPAPDHASCSTGRRIAAEISLAFDRGGFASTNCCSVNPATRQRSLPCTPLEKSGAVGLSICPDEPGVAN